MKKLLVLPLLAASGYAQTVVQADKVRLTTGTELQVQTAARAAAPIQALSLKLLETGSSPQYFTIFTTGDQAADITYKWPLAQGGASTALINDGSGNLSWTSVTEADTLATVTARGATSATLITLDNGNTSAGRIALKEDSDNGSNTGTLTGPASTADVTWTLPAWTGNVAVGTQIAPTTADATADLVIGASSATQTPLVVQGAAAASVPLQEWQTSAGAVAFAIDQNGSSSSTSTADAQGWQFSRATTAGAETFRIRSTYDGSNIGMGRNAMRAAIHAEAYNNIGIGYDSLWSLSSGDGNVAIGTNALLNTASNGYNTGVGAGSLTLATGNTNTAVGSFACDSVTSGSGNLCIGYDADVPSATGNYQLAIGAAITGNMSTGAFGVASLTVGGGYGSTGATISDAGAISADGALTRGTPVTADATADAVLAASSATQTPLVVQGAAAASVPLQEWQTSAGAVVGRIAADGTVSFGVSGPANPSGVQVDIWGGAASTTDMRIASTGNYQNIYFSKTDSVSTSRAWTFGRRTDTYFGNQAGSFQIVGTHVNGAGTQDWLITPFILNPNSDVILAGASNAVNGNVGIGNQSPSAKLDVTGTAAISGTTTIGGGYGSTGATVSDAGALSLDGGLIRGTPVTADATADAVLAASSATQTPLVVQGAAVQSVPLQEWQTSAGVPRAGVNIAAGGFRVFNASGVEQGGITGNTDYTSIARNAATYDDGASWNRHQTNRYVVFNQLFGGSSNGEFQVYMSAPQGAATAITNWTIPFKVNQDGDATVLRTLIAASATIGGGYGSTGATISDAGNLQVDGATTLGAGANHLDVSASGHLTLTGDATVWDDLTIPGIDIKTGGSAPDLTAWLTNLQVYLFDAGTDQQGWFSVQMSHRIKSGAVIKPHVHWFPTVTADGAPASQTVEWCLDYSFSEIGGTYGATATVCGKTHEPADANVVADKHYITALTDITPGTGADGISAILVGRIYRNADDGTDDTYEVDAGLLALDFHIEIDKLGSNTDLAY
jgi:hypothetical protein